MNVDIISVLVYIVASWLIFGAWQWPPFLKGKKNVWIEKLKWRVSSDQFWQLPLAFKVHCFSSMNSNRGINICILMQFNREHQYFIESTRPPGGRPFNLPIETAISDLIWSKTTERVEFHYHWLCKWAPFRSHGKIADVRDISLGQWRVIGFLHLEVISSFTATCISQWMRCRWKWILNFSADLNRRQRFIRVFRPKFSDTSIDFLCDSCFIWNKL